MNRLKALTATGLLILGVASSQARIWKDKSGTHEIDATFVKLDNGQLTVKLKSGKLRTFPLQNLSAADHKFALGQGASSGESAAGVSTSAKARLIEYKSRKKDGTEIIRHQLAVDIDLTGSAAAEAFALGEVLIDQATVKTGEIEVMKQSGGKGFKAIHREKITGYPADGVRAVGEFSKVDKDLKVIESLSGSVQVLSGGEAKSVELIDLHSLATGSVENAELAEAGISVEFERGEPKRRTQMFVTIRDGMHRVTGVRITKKNGSELESTSGSAFSDSKKSVHEIYAPQESLEDGAKITIDFRTGGEEIRLPFSLTDVPVVE